MFNPFNMNLRPFMDEVDSGSGGVATSQETSTESSELTDTSETSTESTESMDQSEGSTDVEVDTKPKQTPEQDRAYAELRRKAEAAERLATETKAQYQRDIEIARKYGSEYGVYSDADISEKYGESHGIHNVAQLEEVIQRQEYEAKGIDPDMIKKIVDDHPAIRQAKAQEQAYMKAREDSFLVESFNELTKEYPEIAKAEDVPADVWRKWRNGSTGLTLVEAYYVANRKEILAKQTGAAKQATLNNIQSKDHVRGNGKGTETDTTRIPDDVMEMYKRFNPGKTMDEYKKHYKASTK